MEKSCLRYFGGKPSHRPAQVPGRTVKVSVYQDNVASKLLTCLHRSMPDGIPTTPRYASRLDRESDDTERQRRTPVLVRCLPLEISIGPF